MSDLAKYNAAKKALAEAVRIDDVKDIRDKAVALRMYAMQAKDRVLVDQATEIRLRAERRVGELLSDTPKNTGARGSGSNQRQLRSHDDTAPTLSDLGINKTQSSRWQKLANLPEADFETIVTKAQHKASDAVDRAQQPKPKSKNKPKPEPKRKPTKGNGADVIAACVVEVTASVRAAVAKLDADKIAFLVDDLKRAIARAVTEVVSRETAEDRWTD